MKLTTISLLAFLAMFKIANANDTHAIELAFWNYTEAAVQSDGDKAAQIFSESGFNYWSKLLGRANSDQKSTILSLPTYQAFNILLIRERARSEKELLSMTGEQWIIHSYSSGWNSNKALNTVISNKAMFELVPEVNGSAADLVLKYNDIPLPTTFPFIKESDGWKIDGKRQFLLLEESIEKRRNQAGVTKEAFCNTMFKALFKKDIPTDLWAPPN